MFGLVCATYTFANIFHQDIHRWSDEQAVLDYRHTGIKIPLKQFVPFQYLELGLESKLEHARMYTSAAL